MASDNWKKWLALALYSAAMTLAWPLFLLRLLWRSKKAPAYRTRWLERFGIPPFNPVRGGIWVHAVSVGETIAIVPTIQTLLEEYPDHRITVTTTTPTGSECVQTLLGDRVDHMFAPYDWPPFVYWFLLLVRPKLAVVVETELWPVSIALCKHLGIKVLVANARLSHKSAEGYKKINWLVRPMLDSIAIAAQHNDDAQRFLSLGATPDLLHITGSVKFDISINAIQRQKAITLKSELGVEAADSAGGYSLRFIWIAASTHQGEDEVILRAHKTLLDKNPDTLLLLVPRHPERFNLVAGLIEDAGLSCVRRSRGAPILAETQVLLVDSMGELSTLYGVADAAFIGGSFVPVGGHNYLEACVWGVPVITGPHQHNFLSIADALSKAQALTTVSGGDELAGQLQRFIDSPSSARTAGNRAVRLLQDNRGASDKLLVLIEALLEETSG